ncbi:hypothetical protein NMY22_g13119 [Coprinellus aureogranulatus]|nr:hypothetical protein NMY22_g13119 [Coprinellus aureogranulatus]
MPFAQIDAAFVGTLLTYLFLGVYITVFGLYMKITLLKRDRFSLADYGVITLFVLTVATIALRTWLEFYIQRRGPERPTWIGDVNSTTSALSFTLDFLSQTILIYRCWLVWGCINWVAIPPGILALTSWICGLVVTIDIAPVLDTYNTIPKRWWKSLGTAGMCLSIAVNASVSTVMISRIWFVHRQTRSSGQSVGSKLPWLISVLLESAIALFAGQIVYTVLYALNHDAFSLVSGPIAITYGLNSTAIMARVGMNRSYESFNPDSTSLGSLVFASGPPQTDKTQRKGDYNPTARLEAQAQENSRNNLHALRNHETETTLNGGTSV